LNSAFIIASAAKQSRAAQTALDCFGLRPRNDEMKVVRFSFAPTFRYATHEKPPVIGNHVQL